MRSKHELLDTCTYAANYEYTGTQDIKSYIEAEVLGTLSHHSCASVRRFTDWKLKQ